MKKILLIILVLMFVMPCSGKQEEEFTMGGEEIELGNPDNGGE